MANRIAGNVIIVDSAMGNSLVLDSAGQSLTFDDFYVSAFGFLSIDTTSTITLTQADTALDLVFKTGYITQGAGTSIQPSLQLHSFSKSIKVGNLKVPILTAGTGFVYLS